MDDGRWLVAYRPSSIVTSLPAHLLRRGDRAELLQQGQHIKVEPRLDDLAFGEARDIDAGHPYRLVSGGHAHNRAGIRSAGGPATGNPITLGHLIFKQDIPATKAATEHTGDHFHAFRPARPALRRVRIMRD